ncbi:hypothetical protein BABINDRAFT_163400 [Babjeviella inositovora NRRL Y-12698]|uniref:Uncharacterized protein n=1 Tax=Babjeviella inositovora NRRL Y-12698 TaxID=984486 RepID=A0A1E3QJ62_9ASCO|nr:uncharacterized protein BABINDRAFT_163400 [Babjeviella inositovora NRRL Y-12698]ODQ77690.1 hypothetical protein BABINDRAFT_163400 [Babjeviella inositovora NRRL Y-12698]
MAVVCGLESSAHRLDRARTLVLNPVRLALNPVQLRVRAIFYRQLTLWSQYIAYPEILHRKPQHKP